MLKKNKQMLSPKLYQKRTFDFLKFFIHSCNSVEAICVAFVCVCVCVFVDVCVCVHAQQDRVQLTVSTYTMSLTQPSGYTQIPRTPDCWKLE